jgi:hypothetical protein
VQSSEFARLSVLKIALGSRTRQNSLFFSLLAGNLGVETGSNPTASATIKFKDLSEKYEIEQNG